MTVPLSLGDAGVLLADVMAPGQSLKLGGGVGSGVGGSVGGGVGGGGTPPRPPRA